LTTKTPYYLHPLIAGLEKHSVETSCKGDILNFTKNGNTISFLLAGENFDFFKHAGKPILPLDQLITSPKKIVSVVLSKLKLNKTVFARNCEVKKVERNEAENFLDTFHLMNSTQSAFNLGLFYRDELIGVASFSKGRKMNRLKENERSFELIRFCCKTGITVTGGLTRLVKNFCLEKNAGDIMTYVDKQLSDGRSFLNAGFKKHSETAPNYFLVNKKTFERTPYEKETKFDAGKFYLSQNSGNIKLIYTPGE
jgi:hypothetical protein